ncbi:helix-turn-helix domain-containing protein [Marivita sp. S6314]|uniref:helix-turn-helix domain-containing protein n=1 Tax=Marivita sp. S6314 TaxID=2926406 RepID=UPI001FF416F7|nr:cupin domain-containing protein [Marivita sp. S6314]MCK0151806.1 helix-turn-helix domain-containing protein [Marivita sp. S6314]
MQHDATFSNKTLGADLRALRKARGLTLQDIADQMDRSVGWVSQIERDLSEPSITDLRQIAKVLDVPISLLFGQANAKADEAGIVVRAGARRPIGSRTAGLIEELLSPDLSDDFEVVHSTFQPHSRAGEMITRPTQEVGYVVSGALDMVISGQRFTLNPGDSFRIKEEPHEWINPYDAPAVVVWVIAPPVY